ncbi:uncharacterized protein F4807DRAFT_118805 [Annulohypoxylon truncatum]|uniref:uncharacterized protein n=1 Tax=Annulohypoxylon truncatum TaxID=327061 RepID=UPI0020075769|nr:uncharacterized protein F4807DRAFT_118805 [Annulohypoxylon truncatum]KAI1214246.1 hypothetical protein F4807DRAFT_118805 [Annulohypoxylon truncatum]
MDWLRESPHMTTTDASIFKFQHGVSTIFEITRGQNRSCWQTQATNLSSDSEWVSWLENRDSSSHSLADGICLVLAGRAERECPDPTLLSRLPFSEEIFGKISKELFIHSSFLRVINRNTAAHCSRQLNAWGLSAPAAIVYNCRSSASWPDDIALSTTYITKRRFTYAIMYGCRSDLATIVMSRLSNCDLTTFHPLSLPMFLADIERNRQVDMVEKYVSKLLQRVLNMSILSRNFMSEDRSEYLGLNTTNTNGSSLTEDHESILDWLEMNHIRDGLKN